MAAISMLLAVFCVPLAVAWKHEHDAKACWRDAAELGLMANGCGG
jgi:hypothetical protein